MIHRFAVAFALVLAVATASVRGTTCDPAAALLPTSEPSPSPILSVESINGILWEHNIARQTVAPMAKTMPLLTWNQVLADFAQEYVDGCPPFEHTALSIRMNSTRFGYSYVGENLAGGGTQTAMGVANGGAQSTRMWVEEKFDWTFPQTCVENKACGHYTQVVWASTLTVGCGYKSCPGSSYGNLWSCVYGPGGNYQGQDPYEQTTTEPNVCQIQSGQPTPTPYPSSAPYTVPPATTTVGPSTTAAATTTTDSATATTTTVVATTSSTTSMSPPTSTTPSPPPTLAQRLVFSGRLSAVASDAAAARADVAASLGIPADDVVVASFNASTRDVAFTLRNAQGLAAEAHVAGLSTGDAEALLGVTGFASATATPAPAGPSEDEGSDFTVVYVCVGIGCFFTLVGVAVGAALVRRRSRMTADDSTKTLANVQMEEDPSYVDMPMPVPPSAYPSTRSRKDSGFTDL